MNEEMFEVLCEDLFTAVGANSPPIHRDEDGNRSVSLRIDDVDLSVVSPAFAPDGALCVAVLGALPQDGELAAMLDMLDANFAFGGLAHTSFCVAPDTGEVVLQATHKLDGLDGSSLLDSLAGMSTFARQWRAGAAP